MQHVPVFGRVLRFIASALLLVSFLAPASVLAAAPTAQNLSLNVNEDASRSITLRVSSSSRSDTFSYVIASVPSHGSVVLNGGTATYTPVANYHGTDRFTYYAVGSVSGMSNIATVDATIASVNDTPSATSNIVVTTAKNTAVTFTVSGSDVDGDVLTCALGGANGGTATIDSRCRVTYTPRTNFTGAGSLSFRVYDGKRYSPSVSATINVTATNAIPVANALSRTVTEDVSSSFSLGASDADGDALTFAIAAPPAHGSVTLSGPTATYRANQDYNGTDSFTFTASDGSLVSTPATVSLSINAVNDVPTAGGVTAVTDAATPITISLSGNDVDGDALTYRVTSFASLGTVTDVFNGNQVTFTPSGDEGGTSTFSYQVTDGMRSANGTVEIHIHAVPVAYPIVLATLKDRSVTFSPAITDADSENVSATVTSPSHGSVTTSGLNWTYTPERGFTGMDTFTYTAFDGSYTSVPTQVRVNVNPPSGLDGVDIVQAGVNFVNFSDATGTDTSSRIFTIMQDLGVQSMRQIGGADTTWSNVELTDGHDNSTYGIDVRQEAHRLDIGVVHTLYRYLFASCTPPWLDYTDPTEFVRQVDATCADYLGRAAASINASSIGIDTVKVEVGNELFHWVEHDNAINYTPEEQALVIRDTANLMRSQVTNASIIAPSIMLNDPLSEDWMTRVHETIGTDWFDVQTIHAYAERWQVYKSQLDTFFEDRHVEGKMVEVTETGYSSDPTSTRFPEASTENKVAAIFQNFSLFWGAGANAVYWHAFFDAENSEAEFRGMGLVDEAGVYDPAAYAYKLMTSELVPFEQVIDYSDEQNGRLVYRFVSPQGTDRYVVWGTSTFTVPEGISEIVSVMPNAQGMHIWHAVNPGTVMTLENMPYLLR